MHHAHHGGHDAEGRHSVAHLGDDAGRLFGFVVVGVDFLIHQRFDLERIQVAAHHQAQVIADEIQRVVICLDSGVIGEQRAFVRGFDVGFDRHHPFAADLGQHHVQQRHHFHIEGLGVLRTLEQARQRFDGGVDGLLVVTDHEGANAGAEDDQQFGRLEQGPEVSSGQHVAAEHRRENHDVTDGN